MTVLLCAAQEATAGDTLSLLGGRLAVAGDASVAYGGDDRGYFNDSAYDHGTLRQLRVGLTARLDLGPRLRLLAEVRSYDAHAPEVTTAFVGATLSKAHAVEVEIGRVPPVFGSWPRRRYDPQDPLLGVPLPYQYATTLRVDAVAASLDELASRRGFGWRVRYDVGSVTAGAGLPLVDGERRDVGAQVSAAGGSLRAALALTRGSLSHPVLPDDNDALQWTGRVAWQPGPAWTAGLSVARGAYLSDALLDPAAAGAGGDGVQRALGADLAWAAGHWLARAEVVTTRWDVPIPEPGFDGRLDAWGGFLEARRKLIPGLSAAVRGEWLRFGRVDGAVARPSWDAPVSRIEVGLSWAVRRDVQLRAVLQHNWREGGPLRRSTLPAVGLSWRF